MGQPITWRNLEGPSFGEASRMMSQAQVGINSGLENFNKVLQNERATADANWGVQKDNNTQAFLSAMNQYRTPEDYQAALASGALDAGQYGAQIDQAAVRSALDGRLSILQDRTMKADQFTDQQKAREAAPIVDKLNMLAMSDDPALRKSAKEALGIYTEQGMIPKAAEVAGKIREVDHQNTTREQETAKAADELLTNASRRRLLSAQSTQALAAAEHYRNESSSSTASLKSQLATSKAERAAAELLIKNSPLDAGHMGTHAGQKVFYDELNKMGLDSTQVKDIGNVIATKYANGIKVGEYDHDDPAGKFKKGDEVRVGVPVSTLLAAVRGSNEKERFRNFFGSSSQGDRVASKLEELLNTRTHVDSMQEALQAQGIQYRPISGSVGATAESSSKTSRRLGIPRPGTEEDLSGSSLLTKATAARLERIKSTLTEAEIADSKNGIYSPRILEYMNAAKER